MAGRTRSGTAGPAALARSRPARGVRVRQPSRGPRPPPARSSRDGTDRYGVAGGRTTVRRAGHRGPCSSPPDLGHHPSTPVLTSAHVCSPGSRLPTTCNPPRPAHRSNLPAGVRCLGPCRHGRWGGRRPSATCTSRTKCGTGPRGKSVASNGLTAFAGVPPAARSSDLDQRHRPRRRARPRARPPRLTTSDPAARGSSRDRGLASGAQRPTAESAPSVGRLLQEPGLVQLED